MNGENSKNEISIPKLNNGQAISPTAKLSVHQRFHTRWRKLRPQTAADCWTEFCRETSLAGFKYLNSDVSIPRRIIWYLVCIAFSVITMVQLIQLFIAYGENPIKTLVDRSYPESVVFPKVVICNTMPFRVSAVRPLSEMHVVLSRIYETPILNTLVAKEKNVHAILSKIKDTRKYFHDVGHQMSDVIIGCTWQGKPCSTDNFTEVITEQGICYAFNSDPNDPLRVFHTGADYGLQLVLNIARYEEMNGPYKVYGATVSISPQSYPASSRSGINALVGTYTTLSLSQKEINFIQGTNCDKKHLKFFNDYNRESCVLEKNFEIIRKECGCYPYTISLDNSSYTAQTNAREICDLAKHLSCAQFHIDQPVGASDDECPSACQVSVHSATVSTAEVAWERLQGNFVNRTARMEKISLDLKHAWEVATRYHPKYAKPTQVLLETLNSATANVSAVIDQITNLTAGFPQIPPPTGELPIKANFEKFLTKTFEPNLLAISKALEDINKTIEMTSSAFMNRSYIAFIFANQTINGTTQEELGLPLSLFNLANGRVYLNTLPAFLQSLDAIKLARANLLKDWREGFYFLNDKTLLLGNDSQRLNSSIDKLMFIIFKQAEYVRQDGLRGCMQRPVHSYNFTIVSSHNRTLNFTEDLLLDVFICFQRLFTSPNSIAAQANNIAYYSDAIPTNAVDIDQHTNICNQVLCRTFQYWDTSNCSFSSEDKLHMATTIDKLINEAIIECSDLKDSAKVGMDNLSNTYVNYLLPQYAKAVELAKSFTKNNQKVLETFSKPLWPQSDALALLSANISNYTNSITNYTDLSKMLTGHYSTWLEQTFSFNLNKVKTAMSETSDILDTMRSELAQMLNFSRLDDELDPNATAEGNGIFAFVTKTLLWQNQTDENIHLSIEAMKELKNLTVPLIAEIAHAGEIFSVALKSLLEDSKAFLTKTQIDQDFFRRNFMVINVNIQELSNEIITQVPAAEFWSLIADLGGAASFWLGVSLVSFIELLDIGIRFGFKCCRIGARKAVRLAKFRAKNGISAPLPTETNEEMAEMRAEAMAVGAVEINGEFFVPELVENIVNDTSVNQGQSESETNDNVDRLIFRKCVNSVQHFD